MDANVGLALCGLSKGGVGEMKILHAFADQGAECPTLDRHGDVIRLSINPEPNQWSDVIQGDVRHPPFSDDVRFDLGIGHPPCGGVSPMSETGAGSRNNWPDLIPDARALFEAHCDDWIIENKPRESLDAEVILTGHMFGLGIEYERAFETTFAVEQPARQNTLAETSPFFYTEKSAGWWASVKGSSTEFPTQHLAKNTIPSAYIDYLLRHYYTARDERDERPDYSNYNKEMDTKRAKEQNTELTMF